MYSKEGYYMVITVLNGRDMYDFMSMMKAHPDIFICFSDRIKVQGDYLFGDKIGRRIDVY